MHSSWLITGLYLTLVVAVSVGVILGVMDSQTGLTVIQKVSAISPVILGIVISYAFHQARLI